MCSDGVNKAFFRNTCWKTEYRLLKGGAEILVDYKHIVGEAYERLADFIILQAAEDYQEALMKIRKHPGNTSAAYEA